MTIAPPLNLKRYRERLPERRSAVVQGRIRRVRGSSLEAVGLLGGVGDVCIVHGQRGDLLAEIVGFHSDRTVLLPLERPQSLAPGVVVENTGGPLRIPIGDDILGRVLDGLGRPLDGLPPSQGTLRDLVANPPNALERRPIDRPFYTGVRSIDLLSTLGRGQRVGIFSGPGVGKSTLLGKVLRDAEADVTVLALIGERGREVRHFLEQHMDAAGRRRSVVVAATSDRPALQRIRGAFLAATVAEYFRDQGRDVLVVMDSASRLALAIREVGLASGEAPATRGYPPSLYSEMPRLLERFGTSEHGSITALLTVLVEGDDPADDPAADCLRGLLDGHLILSRSLAQKGHYPAVDVLGSLSRLMESVTDAGHRRAANKVRSWLALYEEYRDLIEIGAYRPGEQPKLDRVIHVLPQIDKLLRQEDQDTTPFALGLRQLLELTAREDSA